VIQYIDFSPINNNINKQTSLEPISLKRIELSGTPSTGVWQSRGQGGMQNPSTNDRMTMTLFLLILLI